jgi:hypothetical protein
MTTVVKGPYIFGKIKFNKIKYKIIFQIIYLYGYLIRLSIYIHFSLLLQKKYGKIKFLTYLEEIEIQNLVYKSNKMYV